MSTVQENLNQSNPTTIADMLRKLPIGDLLAGMVPKVNARTGLVSGTVHVNDIPGAISAVESPVGTTLTIIGPGDTPAAGEVAVAYSTDGVATLTFQAAVTAYSALQTSLPADLGATLAAPSGAST